MITFFPRVISPYFAALRPRQWTKNLIVFAAPLFAFEFSLLSVLDSLLAFVLFCCISSGFYLFNDIADVESDRHHPVKCKRPIASGLVSIPVATGMAIILQGGTLIVALFISRGLAIAIAIYALLQVLYNLRLKHTVILDVIAISMGFVLRAIGGAAAANIAVSPWFLLCTAMLALFLGIEKRKAELKILESRGVRTRYILKRYSMPLLSRMENVVTTGTIMCYALWSSGPQFHGATTSWMLITLPFVMYGIFRYQLLSDPKEIQRRKVELAQEEGQSERPEEILLQDAPVRLTVIGWVVTVFLILLLEHQRIIA